MYTMGRERALPGSFGQLSHRRTPVAGIGGLPVVLIYRYPPGATAATYQVLGGAVAPNLNTQLGAC
jgi:hypothetical protein